MHILCTIRVVVMILYNKITSIQFPILLYIKSVVNLFTTNIIVEKKTNYFINIRINYNIKMENEIGIPLSLIIFKLYV